MKDKKDKRVIITRMMSGSILTEDYDNEEDFISGNLNHLRPSHLGIASHPHTTYLFPTLNFHPNLPRHPPPPPTLPPDVSIPFMYIHLLFHILPNRYPRTFKMMQFCICNLLIAT